MVYDKNTQTSASTNKIFNEGELTNFVQVDAQTAFNLCFQLTDILSMPIVLVVAFVFLFHTLGLSFFSGIGVFITGFIANFGISYMIQKLNKEFMKKKDARMNLTQQVLSNIKTIKLYSWQDFFQNEV